MFRIEQMCVSCDGFGTIPDTPCKTCNGTALVTEEVVEKITIPPLTRSGEVFKIENSGHISPYGSENGDLLVQLEVPNSEGL